MKYYTSTHFREDPFEEVESALTTNSMESVVNTLEGRLSVEIKQTRPDAEEIQRVRKQLAYVAMLDQQLEVVA